MLPIVLIHGFPLDSGMWEGQAEYLGGKGYQVVTPDLPGFGGGAGAGLGKEGTSMEAFGEFVHEVIQKEAGGRAVVGGFSMGGYVLLALLRDYPEDVAAAMLIDTRADADSAEARANRMAAIAEIEKNGPAKVLDEMIAKQLTKRASGALKEKVRGVMERQSGATLAAALWGMAKRRDQRDLLADLKKEVLIVVGAEDSITPPSVALSMQSLMAHGTVVQVAGAGHLSPMEQPGAVNTAMETFLARVEAGARQSEAGERAR